MFDDVDTEQLKESVDKFKCNSLNDYSNDTVTQ